MLCLIFLTCVLTTLFVPESVAVDQLMSADCHTMPLKPWTFGTPPPYDLESWEEKTFLMSKEVSETNADEVTYTYGCQFGYHFSEDHEGATIRKRTERPFFNIARRTVHCLNGAWDQDGTPVGRFAECRSFFLDQATNRDYRKERNRITVTTLPGYLDHRTASPIEGESLTIPIVHKGGLTYIKEWLYKKTVEEFYLTTEKVPLGSRDDTINSPSWFFNMEFRKIVAGVNDATMLPDLDYTYSYPWVKIGKDTFYVNITTQPLNRWHTGQWFYQDKVRFSEYVTFYRREYFTINVQIPVDGNWTEWGEWGVCVAECGQGLRERSRTCTNPAPVLGGAYCVGNDTDVDTCQATPCPIDGSWSEWQDWGMCSIPCGGTGTKVRFRTCTDPPPQYGGEDCEGNLSDSGVCGTQSCDVDGNWAQWSDWTKCSVTCGFGIKTRTRSCTDPPPSGNGASCPGSNVRLNFYQEEPCMDTLTCPVDGNWTSWTEWTECSVLCGGGMISRNRTCSNPAPAAGGSDCEGNTTEVIYGCNSEPCGVNGNWGEWSSWLAPCTVTCGGGIKTRNRTCDNPPPTHGGKDCRGSATHVKACNTEQCSDGAWTPWSMWSVCSHSCRGGVQARSRSCTNPRPGPDGKDCPAKDPYTMWQRCNTQPCPINGRWTQWSEWSDCPVSCGGGFRLQIRNCTNPPPLWGGRKCRGFGVKEKPCNTRVCPLIGVPHNIKYTSQHSNITVTWEEPLEYVWPINYYTVYFRKRMSHNQTLATLIHPKGESSYHYDIYDLDSFIARPTKDNSTFAMTIRKLDPYTNYEFCLTIKYNHIRNSEHSKVTTVKTKRFPWPAAPEPVTIEYGDVKKEGEYKVLIRWTENTWANYSKPTKYQLRIRDVFSKEMPPKGWITLEDVTTEITGYLLRESKQINLRSGQYIIQVLASNIQGVSDPANCREIINYYSALNPHGKGKVILPIAIDGVPVKWAAAEPLSSAGTKLLVSHNLPSLLHAITFYLCMDLCRFYLARLY